MNFKKITILLLVLLVADQALKIWIKTHMTLDEALEKCNREVGKVRCGNLYHRTDIGRKAIK